MKWATWMCCPGASRARASGAARMLLMLAMLLAAAAAQAAPCGGDMPCRLDGRSYNVLVPEGWDGVTPLPVMMHFHAFLRRGRSVIHHPRVISATQPRGVLLVAPTARERAWRFWQDDPREDIAFADAVLADVARRWPVDRERIFISGFSFGAAMAWRYACARGNRIAGLLSMSGTIAQNSACLNPPRHVRHVHGLQDIWASYPKKGDDLTFAVALWRNRFRCDKGSYLGDLVTAPGVAFSRFGWFRCLGGQDVTLDIHTGGHRIPDGWLGAQLDELMQADRSH